MKTTVKQSASTGLERIRNKETVERALKLLVYRFRFPIRIGEVLRDDEILELAARCLLAVEVGSFYAEATTEEDK